MVSPRVRDSPEYVHPPHQGLRMPATRFQVNLQAPGDSTATGRGDLQNAALALCGTLPSRETSMCRRTTLSCRPSLKAERCVRPEVGAPTTREIVEPSASISRASLDLISPTSASGEDDANTELEPARHRRESWPRLPPCWRCRRRPAIGIFLLTGWPGPKERRR